MNENNNSPETINVQIPIQRSIAGYFALLLGAAAAGYGGNYIGPDPFGNSIHSLEQRASTIEARLAVAETRVKTLEKEVDRLRQ